MKKIYFLILLSFLYSFSADAQIENDNGLISLYSTVCEKITNGESRSSARMRATDKASFKSVENISELKHYKDTFDSHNFNLKVYKLVDNYLEDIKINVTSQSETEVCVEVSAFIQPSAIKDVFDSNEKNLDPIIDEYDETADEVSLELEDDYIDENINITIPPKPQIVINENISYQEETPVVEQKQPDKKELIHEETDKKFLPKNKGKIRVFIDKTSFYNNSETTGFFPYIEHELNQRANIEALKDLDNPDYIIKSRVLKARVDEINAQTSRLQIVVAVDLTDTQTSKTVTEHQNRFVLYNSTDDGQATASDLTKKLIISAVKKIIPHIKNKSGTINESMITPH